MNASLGQQSYPSADDQGGHDGAENPQPGTQPFGQSRPGADSANNPNGQPSWQPGNNWNATQPQPGYLVTDSERTWAVLAHLSALLAWGLSAGWLTFVGPLLVWFIKKDSSPYARSAAAQSFNFNVGMWVMTLVGWMMIFTILLIPLGILLLVAVFVMMLWHHIRAAMAASRCELYRYPWQLPILN